MKKVISLLATASLLSFPVVAQAATFEVTVPNTKLELTTSSLTINVSGVPEGQGIYFMLCEGSSATPRPTNCSTDNQAWLSTAPSALRMGAVPVLAVNDFKVATKFATRSGAQVDCTVSACGVFVRRDHFGTADQTLDKFFPITFSAPKPQVSALIGSFDNRVAVRVFGAESQQLSVKISGRWFKSMISANNSLRSFRVGAKAVNVEVFVGGERISERRVVLG